jgi:hypothetical protein
MKCFQKAAATGDPVDADCLARGGQVRCRGSEGGLEGRVCPERVTRQRSRPPPTGASRTSATRLRRSRPHAARPPIPSAVARARRVSGARRSSPRASVAAATPPTSARRDVPAGISMLPAAGSPAIKSARP